MVHSCVYTSILEGECTDKIWVGMVAIYTQDIGVIAIEV